MTPYIGPTPYILRREPFGLVMAAFFLATIPLIALEAVGALPAGFRFVYFAVVAGSHFAATLTIYFDPVNFAYFTRNWPFYVAAPVAILVASGYVRFFLASNESIVVGAVVLLGAHAIAQNHVNRQTFGVLQMMHAPNRQALATRDVERVYLGVLTVLSVLSLSWGGRFNIYDPVTRAFSRCTDVRALRASTLYFVVQSLSAGIAIYNVQFGLFALAIHHVEYHVLMHRRAFGGHTQHAVVSYSAFVMLLGFAIAWGAQTPTASTLVQTDALWLRGAFDGLTLVHFFLEALIWRFKDPHWKRTLAPLFNGG